MVENSASAANNKYQHCPTECKEQKQYIKNKLLYEAVLQCIKEKNGLWNESIENIHQILINEDILQQVKLDTHDNVLGLININSQDISYEEGKLLKNEIEQKLFFLHNMMHKPVSDTIEQYHSKSQNTEAKLLVDFRLQLNDEQDRYMKNLHKHITYLKELFNLRNKCLTEISNNKMEECNTKIKIQSIKLKILHEKTKMDIFTDTKMSLDAYRELIKDVGQQQQECQCEVEKLGELKEKYQQVGGPQFENILKRYVEYKTATEKKIKLCKQIKIK